MTHADFNHLLTSIQALTRKQVRRLRERLDRRLAEPNENPDAASEEANGFARRRSTRKRPPTRDELNRRLMAAGLVMRLPDPSLDVDDDDPDDQPVPIRGEPLSETILRERR